MSWSRWGDTIATDPRVLDLGERRCEVLGFFLLVVTHSAQHDTDGRITEGMARNSAPATWQELVRDCVKAGLLTKVPRRSEWQILEDPEFVHLRPAAEVEWERQRRRDSANPGLTMPVRRRDGDGCRYCGCVTIWTRDRKSSRAGTYDHREPGRPATLETYVVACSGCNSARGAHTGRGMTPAEIDELIPLLPTPDRPYYSKVTARQLTAHYGVTFLPTDLQISADIEGPVGTGRDGTGRVGSGPGQGGPR